MVESRADGLGENWRSLGEALNIATEQSINKGILNAEQNL